MKPPQKISLAQRIARRWNMLRYGVPRDFDDILYLRLNPDVLRANVDPVQHFIEFGRKEGRNWKLDLPGDFNPAEYLRLNADVAKANADPELHFMEFGRKEDRAWKSSKQADILWAAGSLNSNPELVESYQNINIVRYRGQYWAVPQALGEVDFKNDLMLAHPQILSASTREGLMARLSENSTGTSLVTDESRRGQPNELSAAANEAVPINTSSESAKAVDARQMFNDVMPFFRKGSTVVQGLELLRAIKGDAQDQSIVLNGKIVERRPDTAGNATRTSVLPARQPFFSASGAADANTLRSTSLLVPRSEITEHTYAKVTGEQKLISVVIPYFRKSSTILRCLEALRHQSYELCGREDIEIIIVDDGTPDEKIHEHLPDDVHYVWQKKVKYGICRAKNTGAKLSNGRYIAFIDPDVIVGRHYFDSVLRGFSTYGDRIVQTGYVFGYYYFTNMPEFTDSEDPRTEFGVWENPGILTSRFYQVAGLNSVMSRQLFSETPGFDEDLIYGGVEDILLGYHVGQLPGTAVVFSKDMECHHIPHPMGGAHLDVGRTWEIVKRKWPEFYTDYRENGSR